MSPTRVGVLGSGQVGRVLAHGFLRHGHEVMLGSRDPAKVTDWQSEADGRGEIGDFAETAHFGEIIVLAALGRAASAVLELARPENLEGKLIIDATNPIAEGPPDHGVIKFFTKGVSLLERLQAQVPAARFVKAFSSVGSALMVNPEIAGGPPTMFICGNDNGAKMQVTEILDRFGWDAADMGGAEGARAIEPLCMLWCIPGLLRNEWSHAFKLLTV